MRTLGYAIVSMLVALACGAGVRAQERGFADRPIQVIEGFPAGGLIDAVSRIATARMERDLGVHIVTVPMPGAGGAIAMKRAAEATPDAHTLMLLPSGTLFARPLVMGMRVDYRSFAPIATVAINFTMIAVRADSPWQSFNDVVRDARLHPGKYAYATSGVGGNPHLAMEYTDRAAGIELVHVPYQGSPQAILGVLGHEADLVVTDNTSPRIRYLATLNAKRSPFHPDVPTLRELGYDVEMYSRFSFVAPKGAPPALLHALERAARLAVADPGVREQLERLQLEPVFESADELAALWPKQAQVYATLVNALGLAHPAGVPARTP
jgi:tripartite-type tricarboxylate transporter receptor subunit TctC